MSVFNSPEIVDIGIEKEEMRRDFYNKVAETFEDSKIKDLFIRLRDWEDAHIKRFKEIKDKIIESQSAESYPGEEKAYINALLDDTLYNEVSPKEFGNKVRTPIAAIEYGLSFEKDAILFFSEFIKQDIQHEKDVIQQLINEEKQHIVYLTQLKRELKGHAGIS